MSNICFKQLYHKEKNMVSWYKIAVTSAILYLVPVKFLIKTFIEYYKNRPIKLHRKAAVVVLDTIGMNFEKAREIAKKGAKIIIASVDIKKAELAKKELIKITKNKNITTISVDCKDKDSLLNFAKFIGETQRCVDIIINNDGFDISDMDIDFRSQQLAEERFRNHCLQFLYEGENVKNKIGNLNQMSLTSGSFDGDKK